jgi:hypothetical protein
MKKTSGKYKDIGLNNVLNDEEQAFMEDYDRNRASGRSESPKNFERYMILLRRIHESLE